MAKVDPYMQPLPQTIQDKNGNITAEFRQWLIYDNRWKFDMWVRSGGGTDAVEAGQGEHGYSENLISLLIGQVAFLKERVDDLQNQDSVNHFIKSFRAVTKSEDYTAIEDDFVNAKLGATIALPRYPDENAVVIIRNGDGSTIKLNGNGKTINGSTTGKIYRKGTAIVWQYFIDSDEWLAR